jgi:hypothetical protein
MGTAVFAVIEAAGTAFKVARGELAMGWFGCWVS